MKHLIICREYPPAPGGGIGTYVFHISRLLADSGETVHVIGQLWEGAEKKVEEDLGGRLVIHRVPYKDWGPGRKVRHSGVKSTEGKALFESCFPPQCFSWEAGLLAESLIDREGIDIIEAQEFEAPSYYLQVRRALGLGPQTHPPLMIHLHSPMEFIARHNDNDLFHPYFLTQKRLEDYCIAAADALLCPSHFLANQAEAHYGLKKHRIQIIPYPLGDGWLLERDKNTWECGTICYLGRLERRKGVIEWIDAAVSVAPDFPGARFEFIGGNGLGNNPMSADAFVESRIPRDVRHQFLFRGAQDRSLLPTFLSGARMSVVPSRWENFPYACIEAMCSGLPVIVSREGGMAEMITEGQTGWLVNKAGHEGLAEALRRALKTAPQRIEQMGEKASEVIREMCGNEKILGRHLKFRSRLSQQGPSRSFHLPVNLPWARTPFSGETSQRSREDGTAKGLAIVVICSSKGRFLSSCLQSIKRQVSRPASVVIVDARSNDTETLEAFDTAQKAGWRIIRTRLKGSGSIKNAGIEAVLGSGLNPLGFSFLSAEDCLHSGFVATCMATLERCPDVGLVSCWARCTNANNRIWTAPCPSFPTQWVSNDVGPFSVIRMEAVREVGVFRPTMDHGYEDWDLANAVMAAGWKAVTMPELLIDHPFGEDPTWPITNAHGSGRMPREILERFPELVARDAAHINLIALSSLRSALSAKRQQLMTPRTLPRHIRGAALQMLRRVRNALGKP